MSKYILPTQEVKVKELAESEYYRVNLECTNWDMFCNINK